MKTLKLIFWFLFITFNTSIWADSYHYTLWFRNKTPETINFVVNYGKTRCIRDKGSFDKIILLAYQTVSKELRTRTGSDGMYSCDALEGQIKESAYSNKNYIGWVAIEAGNKNLNPLGPRMDIHGGPKSYPNPKNLQIQAIPHNTNTYLDIVQGN